MTRLGEIAQHECIKLVTFKRDGNEVATPVWFIVHEEKIYCRTAREFGKVKRLRNNPAVRFCPCDWHGNEQGPWHTGRAALLDHSSAPAERADQLLKDKYGSKRQDMSDYMEAEQLTAQFIQIDTA